MDITGNLIIAPPAVKGNFWYKTVILVTEHHINGSVGLVLNKRSQMSLPEFGQQLGINLDLPGFVYLGGPINVKNLTFLHSNDWASKNTMRISDDLSISSADDILPRLAMGDKPAHWRIFLGMAGWGPSQLEGELKGTPPWNHTMSWCTAKSDLDIVFGSDTNDQWCAAIDRSGQEFAQNLFA
jgi:putative transcriptional regulator